MGIRAVTHALAGALSLKDCARGGPGDSSTPRTPAVFIDLYSRKVVGWCVREDMTQQIILRAFKQAVIRRGNMDGLMVHSDRGAQYASTAFRSALAAHAITQSMSGKEDCWDNAPAESFFATLKVELVGTTIFDNRSDAERKLFEYIEVFYNRQRLHSTLSYRTPVEIEESSTLQTDLSICPF